MYKKKEAEMCSERDSPLKRLYRQTHAKLTRLAGSGQLVWAAGCELSLALIHALLALDPCLIYDTDEGMAAGSGTSLARKASLI